MNRLAHRLVQRSMLLAALLLTLAGCATHNTINEGRDSNLMLKGHDPIAYFTRGKPTLGRPDIKDEHEGVIYRFASEANRAQFRLNPDKFKPQYNGFCSNGIVYAIPLGGEPEYFKIVKGRLFMFGSADAKQYWEMEEKRNIELGDNYWRTEVQGKSARLQAWKRLAFRVPHYKTNGQLAAELDTRQIKR